MKHIEQKTIHVYEVSNLDRLILMGLLSKVITKEPIELDEEATFKITEILTGLANV